MEESISSNIQINCKQFLQPNSLFQALYIYSSRYLTMPEKQRNSDSFHEQIITINDPLYKQSKQRFQTEYDTLIEYIDNVDDKFKQVNRAHLDVLSQKHRYFLRKFKKYLSEHKKLSQIYENLQNIVIQNPAVQDQINSINFIKMISAETQEKLEILTQTVHLAEEQKLRNCQKIESLRKELNELKNKFFVKKREQISFQLQIQEKQRNIKQTELQQKMKKIRLEKRQKDTFIKDIFHQKTQNSADRSNFPLRNNLLLSNSKTSQRGISNIDLKLSEFKNINRSNQSYIKSLQQTTENFRHRKLQDKKKLNNKLVEETNLQDFRIKSRHQSRLKRSQDEELLKNEAILQQLTIINRMRQEFQQKKPKQILDILTRNNRIKDLLNIVEEIKLKEAKQSFMEKHKINFVRSQAYKSNTHVVSRSFQVGNLQNSLIIG